MVVYGVMGSSDPALLTFPEEEKTHIHSFFALMVAPICPFLSVPAASGWGKSPDVYTQGPLGAILQITAKLSTSPQIPIPVLH